MFLEQNEKLLIAHRRMFKEDHHRFFVGAVDHYQDGLALVTGYTFTWNPMGGEMLKKPDIRRKIISLTSGTLITYLLHRDVDIHEIRFERTDKGQLILTDGEHVKLDLTEQSLQPGCVATWK